MKLRGRLDGVQKRVPTKKKRAIYYSRGRGHRKKGVRKIHELLGGGEREAVDICEGGGLSNSDCLLHPASVNPPIL